MMEDNELRRFFSNLASLKAPTATPESLDAAWRFALAAVKRDLPSVPKLYCVAGGVVGFYWGRMIDLNYVSVSFREKVVDISVGVSTDQAGFQTLEFVCSVVRGIRGGTNE